MTFDDLAALFDKATTACVTFAQTLVWDELPKAKTYRLFPNQSYDARLKPDEVVYLEDTLSEDVYLAMSRDATLRFLYRDGHVPEWVDVSVSAADREFTYVDLLCCGRFAANDERLYYRSRGQGPFGIKSPAFPPKFEADRTGLFWLRDSPQHRGLA
ncbi:hypothetical protein [Alienimonas californiensis]|nr:hypothetical protein [Alienimonas californiensis]